MRKQIRRLAPAPDRLKSGDSWRADKGKTAARGYGHEWQSARAEYLEANPLCVRCRELGIIEAARVVDHVRPHRGDMKLFWDWSNWQALCKPCHSSWKQRQEAARIGL